MSEAKQRLAAAMADLGLTVEAAFVPWSKSRNYGATITATHRTLNWRVTLKRDGRTVLTTDYSAGIGHAPSYKLVQGGRLTLEAQQAIEHETERGTAARAGGNTGHVFSGKPLLPDACDVVYGLVSDSDVIEHASFESWANDLGYDTDSRSAERTYRACLDTALALRAALGDDGLAKLREACQDY